MSNLERMVAMLIMVVGVICFGFTIGALSEIIQVVIVLWYMCLGE